MKLVISDQKTGKSYQTEVDETKSKIFYGKKIGNEVDGGALGLAGYTLRITGGSDKEGYPMRPDVHGTDRKRILLTAGAGIRNKKIGERKKKTIRGNIVSESINQMNLIVLKAGDKSVAASLGIEEKKPEEKTEGA